MFQTFGINDVLNVLRDGKLPQVACFSRQ